MSGDFLSRATGATDTFGDAREAAGYLQKPLPHIARILMGEPKVGADTARLPGSIRLFTNGTDLKACISGREWIFDGYVVLPKELDLLAALELELEAGRIGWSVVSVQKDTSRKAPY